jgi:hypothetical protein
MTTTTDRPGEIIIKTRLPDDVLPLLLSAPDSGDCLATARR